MSLCYKETLQKKYGYQSNLNSLTSKKNIFPNLRLPVDQHGQRKEVYQLMSDFERQYEKSMPNIVTGLQRRSVVMRMQHD